VFTSYKRKKSESFQKNQKNLFSARGIRLVFGDEQAATNCSDRGAAGLLATKSARPARRHRVGSDFCERQRFNSPLDAESWHLGCPEWWQSIETG